MAKTTITIAGQPDYIYVGETLGFNISTDGEITFMGMNPMDVVSINDARDKITGVKAGTVEFTIKAQRLGYEETTLIVNLRCIERQGKQAGIMLHNRSTNRLTSVQTQDLKNPTDIVIKLPKLNADSTLVTKEALTSKIGLIVTPTIIDPTNGATNVEGWITGSDYQTQVGFQGEHEASVWEYASDSEFKNILDTVYINRASDKTKGPVIHSLSTVYVRVKYVSGDIESYYSDPIQITTGYKGRDSKETIIKGDPITGAYMGVVPHDECIGDRNYRGNFETLDKYNLKKFYKGWQVHKGDTLYYALRDITAAECKDPSISAPAGDGQWSYDHREDMPTPEWVNSVTGIGFGFTDNNGDGYSSGDKSVGAIQDHELGWIKYIYKGKLCYTPVKPICTKLCWNDIAKRDIMYGERTFRAGATQMYRIRLMREDEYKTIIPGLMDGTLANYSMKDLGQVNDKDESIARLTWIEDFQEGSKRKVGDHTGKKVYETDPKTRVGVLGLVDGVTKWEMSYRPVIELVTEPNEPWRNWPICVEADNEEFRYDKYTDTGYFGRVRADMMIRGDNLANSIGLTAGTGEFPDAGWFKFYWHGVIVYIRQKPMRYGLHSASYRTLGITCSFDTGNKLLKRQTFNQVEFIMGVPIGSRYDPFVNSADYKNDKILPGSYSHFSELLMRVYIRTGQEYYLGSDTTGNSTIGAQVGDNWDTLDFTTEIGSDPEILGNPTNGNSGSSWDPMTNTWYSYGSSSGSGVRDLVLSPIFKYPISNHVWLEKNLNKDQLVQVKLELINQQIKELEAELESTYQAIEEVQSYLRDELKIDIGFATSTPYGNTRDDQYRESPIKIWPTKENNYLYSIQNPVHKHWKTFTLIFITNYIQGYPPDTDDHFSIGMCLENFTSGLFVSGLHYTRTNFVNEPEMYIPHYALNSDVSGYTHKHGIKSSKTGKSIRFDSEQGIEIDNMIKDYRAPIHIIEELNNAKQKRKDLIS